MKSASGRPILAANGKPASCFLVHLAQPMQSHTVWHQHSNHRLSLGLDKLHNSSSPGPDQLYNTISQAFSTLRHLLQAHFSLTPQDLFAGTSARTEATSPAICSFLPSVCGKLFSAVHACNSVASNASAATGSSTISATSTRAKSTCHKEVSLSHLQGSRADIEAHSSREAEFTNSMTPIEA
ncbi:TPA: hypothetical protein ACH3X3_003525 [Trebouxia sp. C0006]